jgi:uncharacterized protein (DUF1778 family)
MFTRDVLQRLAGSEPGSPTVSVYVRTDPRDPANTSGSPAWQVALRNGLAGVSERLESGGEREERLAFRDLRERIEKELADMPPAERARSVAWFLDLHGGSSERYGLQLPLRSDAVVLDARPFVSPLVDVADRGAPTGVLLVSGELVRLLHIEQGEASEPEDSTFEIELGDWRSFGGTAGGSAERGMRTTSHEERLEARVEAQRDQLFETAAEAAGKRLEQLGWERIVLVSETQVATRFRAALPAKVAEHVVAEADRNLVGEDPSTIADLVGPLIEQAWRERSGALVELARERAQAGGTAALGAQETFGSLAEGRVSHLLLDPAFDFSACAGMLPAAFDGPPELLAERAVEAAVATSAEVTSLAAADSPALAQAGGAVALLRY